MQTSAHTPPAAPALQALPLAGLQSGAAGAGAGAGDAAAVAAAAAAQLLLLLLLLRLCFSSCSYCSGWCVRWRHRSHQLFSDPRSLQSIRFPARLHSSRPSPRCIIPMDAWFPPTTFPFPSRLLTPAARCASKGRGLQPLAVLLLQHLRETSPAPCLLSFPQTPGGVHLAMISLSVGASWWEWGQQTAGGGWVWGLGGLGGG